MLSRTRSGPFNIKIKGKTATTQSKSQESGETSTERHFCPIYSNPCPKNSPEKMILNDKLNTNMYLQISSHKISNVFKELAQETVITNTNPSPSPVQETES